MLLHSKETINKMKRQPAEWEEVSANLISDKGLISKKYQNINSAQNSKTKQKNHITQFKNRQVTWIDIFSKENIQMSKRLLKRCLTWHTHMRACACLSAVAVWVIGVLISLIVVTISQSIPRLNHHQLNLVHYISVQLEGGIQSLNCNLHAALELIRLEISHIISLTGCSQDKSQRTKSVIKTKQLLFPLSISAWKYAVLNFCFVFT